MNKRKIAFAFYGVIILLIPFYLIFKSESILTEGHQHKIRLQCYDPMDPFRGKYLRLSLNTTVPCENDVKMGSPGYVILKKDSLGFSYFASVQAKRPSHSDYIEAEVQMVFSGNAVVDLDNMNKYFINEDIASEGEQIIGDFTSQAPDKIWLNIRVLDGEARIEDVIVKSKKLLDYIKSGKHKTFEEDLEREREKEMERERKRMEEEYRKMMEEFENNSPVQEETIEFDPPAISE